MTADSSTISQARSFPREIIDRLQHWRDHSAVAGQRMNECSNCGELDDTLRSTLYSASQLGLPRAARLAATMRVAMEQNVARCGELTADRIIVALDTLIAILNSPTTTHRLPLASVISDLRREIGAGAEAPSQTAMYRDLPWRTKMETDSDSESCVPGELANLHTDACIYKNASLDALARCTAEESWMVAQITTAAEDFAMVGDGYRPAQRLMNILHDHRYFQDVDRVCFAGRVNGGNQLVVVDSAISPRMREQGISNAMKPGYSCFVNPAGSLTRMRPAVLRVFADCKTVLESFAKERRPAQRSIAYIADSGLRSGLCLAVGRNDRVQGFLFMNSLVPGHFERVTADYSPLLSLIGTLGTIVFDAAGYHADELPFGNLLPRTSEIFAEETLLGYLGQCLAATTGLKVTANIERRFDAQFLYYPSSVISALADLIAAFGELEKLVSLSLELDSKSDVVQISFPCRVPTQVDLAEVWQKQNLDRIKSKYRAQVVEMGIGNQRVFLRFPFELTFGSDAEARYSVSQ